MTIASFIYFLTIQYKDISNHFSAPLLRIKDEPIILTTWGTSMYTMKGCILRNIDNSDIKITNHIYMGKFILYLAASSAEF